MIFSLAQPAVMANNATRASVLVWIFGYMNIVGFEIRMWPLYRGLSVLEKTAACQI